MQIQGTQDGCVRRFPSRVPRSRVGTVRCVRSLLAPSGVCVDPDTQVEHSHEKFENINDNSGQNCILSRGHAPLEFQNYKQNIFQLDFQNKT